MRSMVSDPILFVSSEFYWNLVYMILSLALDIEFLSCILSFTYTTQIKETSLSMCNPS